MAAPSSLELPAMDYASLIRAIQADVQALPFESAIRGAVVIRRLCSDLPESESGPGRSEARVMESVRRTIAESRDVHPMPSQFGEGHVLVFCREVTEGPRRWELEVEVAVDPAHKAV